MKRLLLIASACLMAGCAVVGTSMIHSPASETGTPSKMSFIHGGAAKDAPPDKIRFQLQDSLHLFVGARTISDKRNFAGVIFPVFPVFWFPRINRYKKNPNELIIQLSTEEYDTGIQVNAGRVLANDRSYDITKVTRKDRLVELSFPLTAKDTQEFELQDLTVILRGQQATLPPIHFQKMKQRWSFIGP